MEFRHIPWNEARTPGENGLRRCLESEGFDVKTWRDPADRVYAPHRHPHDESLWVLRGRIVLHIDGRDVPLGPGDRVELPGGTPHTARCGPEGAVYLIGRRRPPD
ncbi:MAG: cupin domain-containing protein [Myxococcota bacterium]|nr:cupin domain-containing protein [Myxococcota bacterium]